MDWQEKLMKQLDNDQPRWYLDWASQGDMRDALQRAKRVDNVSYLLRHDVDLLRRNVANHLFHRIIRAAIDAGIVTEIKEP